MNWKGDIMNTFVMAKMVFRRMREEKLTTFLLMFGLTLSILLISVGTSFVTECFRATDAKAEGMPSNSVLFMLERSTEKKFELEDFNKLFKGLPKGSGIIVNEIMLHVNGSEINSFASVSAEWFANDDGWHYPIAEGRYFTSEEIQQKKKVIMIGSGYKDCIWEENGKKYVTVREDNYEVIGIVGFKKQRSAWDYRLFMPCTALPEEYIQEINTVGQGNISFILYDENGNLEKDVEKIEKNGKKLYQDFSVTYIGEIQVEDVASNIIASQDNIFLLAGIGYIVTVLFAINVVVLWSEKRRYEMVVRKAFGYTNTMIAKMIFSEILGVAVLSSLVSVAVQGILSVAVGQIAKYTLEIYWQNILVGIVVVFLTAILTTIWPVMKIAKIQPADGIQEK